MDAHLNSVDASRASIVALNDHTFAVRRCASAAIGNAIPPELDAASAPEYQRECAAFILASANQARARQRMIDCIESLVSDAYAPHLHRVALADLKTPGARLLQASFREETDAILERVF